MGGNKHLTLIICLTLLIAFSMPLFDFYVRSEPIWDTMYSQSCTTNPGYQIGSHTKTHNSDNQYHRLGATGGEPLKAGPLVDPNLMELVAIYTFETTFQGHLFEHISVEIEAKLTRSTWVRCQVSIIYNDTSLLNLGEIDTLYDETITWSTSTEVDDFVNDNGQVKLRFYMCTQDSQQRLMIDFLRIVLGEAGSTEYYAVIFVGHVEDGSYERQTLENSGSHAYSTLKSMGYSDEHILYLDVDGAGAGVDNDLTWATAENAITQWATEKVDQNDQLLLYFVSVGDYNTTTDEGYLRIDLNNDDYIGGYPEEADRLYYYQVEQWLQSISDYWRMIILIDCCFSARAIEHLTASDRVIITSANVDEYSGYSPEGPWRVFSYPFFEYVDGNSVVYAYNYASDEAYQQKNQNAMLDDNGDGIGNHGDLENPLPSGNEGYLAQSCYL